MLTKEEGQQLKQLRTGLDEMNNKGFSERVDVLKEFKSANVNQYQKICNRIGESFLSIMM